MLPHRLTMQRAEIHRLGIFRVFMRITWAPSETEFNEIRTQLDNRMPVVVRIAVTTEDYRLLPEVFSTNCTSREETEAAGVVSRAVRTKF